MADFPYTLNPPSLKRFLGHIQSAGVPPKVTTQYLEKSGFKSKNDRSIITVLKFVGFLGDDGVPTEIWKDFRNRDKAGAVLAAAMRGAYSDLFNTYPDAHRKDNEALRNYFSAHSRGGERTLTAIVGTFRALSELGDFERGDQYVKPVIRSPERTTSLTLAPHYASKQRQTPSIPTININIQLQLPATEDSSIYDKLFAAMKKHLFTE